MTFEVRTAEPADAQALGRVHVQAWLAAYRGLMPDVFLDGLDEQAWVESWSRQLAEPVPPRLNRLVCTSGADVIGFAVAGPSRDDGAAADDGELYAINLHPDHWGRGGGTVLVASAVARLADDGFTNAALWVLPANVRARAFYEARGWHCDDITREQDVMGVVVPEVRYSRAL